jgi:hypothetical protein
VADHNKSRNSKPRRNNNIMAKKKTVEIATGYPQLDRAIKAITTPKVQKAVAEEIYFATARILRRAAKANGVALSAPESGFLADWFFGSGGLTIKYNKPKK